MKLNLISLILLFITLAHGQEDPVYRLKANDTVRLTVFQEPDLTVTEKLTVAGEVSFPLVGSIKLLGLTIREAETLTTARYDADYLVKPSLSINVIEASDEVISVLGAVNNPGDQNISVNTTLDLLTALDSAGGLAPHANPERIELKRDGQTMTFQMNQLRSPDAPQIVLEHGDRVNVTASRFANQTVTILGQVAQPGSVAFPVDGKLSLDLLLAKSGELTDTADPDRITVKRNGQVISGKIGQQQALLPGDLVTVPASRFVGKSVTLSGSLNRVGEVPFPLDGQLTLLKLINGPGGGFTRVAKKSKVRLTRVINGVEKVYGPIDFDKIQNGEERDIAIVPGDRVHVPERIF